MSTKVVLGRSARNSIANTAKLERKAANVAASLTVPPGLEFARFEHDGRTYALSAKLIVEVELLDSRVPDVVIRSGAISLNRRGRPR
jgi:hypothetical protein